MTTYFFYGFCSVIAVFCGYQCIKIILDMRKINKHFDSQFKNTEIMIDKNLRAIELTLSESQLFVLIATNKRMLTKPIELDYHNE